MSMAVGSDRPSLAHTPATSQESLARSIAREVQSRLPASGSVPGLASTVEASIRQQAMHNERILAYVRVAAGAAITLVALIGRLRPGLVGVNAVPAEVVWAVGLATLAAAAFLVALRRGWYHRRVRQLVPAADALLIGVPVLLLAAATPPVGRPSLSGVASLSAVACALLVVSGSVRLSRSAQRVATTLATATWLVIAWSLAVPALVAAFIAAVLVVIGVLGTRFGSLVRSIVAQRVADERLHALYHDARAAIEAREEVLRIVAHDLRNPLSTIKMSTAMMRDLPADGRDDTKYLSAIARCTDSMNRIIHDLLDVARMEAGRLVVEPSVVEVAELLDRVLELMCPIAEEHQLRLEAEPVSPGLRVRVDADRIQQVFSNLIGNAVKFTPAGATITIQARRTGDSVRFSVLDMGPGVPPERVERLFERFWQANSGDRRGIGLGLAIARSIVDAHDGRIGVESRSGGGSEFWFTAPLAEPTSVARDGAGGRARPAIALPSVEPR